MTNGLLWRSATPLCVCAILLYAAPTLSDSRPPNLLIDRGSIQVSMSDLIYYIEDRLLPEAYERGLSKPGAIKHSLRNIYVIRRAAEIALAEGLVEESRLAYVATDSADREALDAFVADRTATRTTQVDWEALAQEEYNVQADKYTSDEQVKVSHILISSEGRSFTELVQAVEAVATRLAAGDPFHVVAKELSDEGAASLSGGSLAFFRRGQMDPAFEEAAFAMKVAGEISDPVLSSFGVHFIRFEERRPAKPIEFEAVRGRLIKMLKKQHESDMREAVLTPLRTEVDDDIQGIDEESIAKQVYEALVAE